MFLNVFIQKFLKKYNIALYCVFSTFSWLMSLTRAAITIRRVELSVSVGTGRG